MKKLFLFVLCFILLGKSFSQNENVNIYPTNWWVGMKWNHVQLMVRSQGIKSSVQNAEINYPGVKLTKVSRLESPDYIFLDVTIAPNTKPGIIKIKLNRINYQPLWLNYELKAKSKEDGKTRVQGVTSKDAIYLLMPDRFADGDPSNDAFKDMRDTVADRNNKFARHGGDLKGIEDHLDYFTQLGVTAIWCTPLVENDMPMMHEGKFAMSG